MEAAELAYWGQVLGPRDGGASKSSPYQGCGIILSATIQSGWTLCSDYSLRTPCLEPYKDVQDSDCVSLRHLPYQEYEAVIAGGILESALPANHHASQVGQRGPHWCSGHSGHWDGVPGSPRGWSEANSRLSSLAADWNGVRQQPLSALHPLSWDWWKIRYLKLPGSCSEAVIGVYVYISCCILFYAGLMGRVYCWE